MITHLFDDLHLAVETSCSTLNQRHVGRQTHPVDMAPRIQVIQSIEHYVKCRKPIHVELAILDIGMIRFQFCVGLEFVGHILRNLYTANGDSSEGGVGI